MHLAVPSLLRLSFALIPLFGLPHSVGSNHHSATYRYRVEIEGVADFLDEENVFADTSMTVAMLTLTLSDTTGGRVAAFRIDSVWHRHSAGLSRSETLQFDGETSGYAVRYFIAPMSLPIRIGGTNIAPGRTSRALTPMIRTLFEFFPAIRDDLPVGESWGDSTATGGSKTKGHWRVVARSGGVTEFANVQNVSLKFTEMGEDKESGSSIITWRRELAAAPGGPITRSTIVENRYGTIDSPSDSTHSVMSSRSTTRIVRVP